jgi:siroheme synthase-like protein
MDHPRYYPIAIRLDDRDVVVIGGGAVAERKVAKLLECGARVRVVTPEATDRLRAWAKDGALRLDLRPAETADIEAADLVFLASSDSATNGLLAAAARDQRIPVNRADAPEDCDFLVPATVERGPMTVAVISGGAAPALTQWVRRRIEEFLGDDMERAAAWFIPLRRRVLELQMDQAARAALLREILESGALDAAAAGDEAAANRLADNLIRSRGRAR